MNAPNIPLVDFHKPGSFLERGIAVPFTTPQLAGARIRPAARTGTEFVVPNPSGGRGVYILTWSGVRQLCRPTVHDTLLHQRVSRLKVMEPGGVRLAARQLAAEGVAGRDAFSAAAASAAADREELILINFLMLVTLMEQIEPAGLRIAAGTQRTPELDLRARRIVTRVSATIGRSVAQIGEDLEALSALFVAIGLDADMPPARLPRLMARLDDAADRLAKWAAGNQSDVSTGLAASLGRSAAVTVECARGTLASARRLTHDLQDLLRAWAAAPDEIVRQATRTEWILDGWERFCLLWETAPHISQQRAVLREMAQLVPMLPKEGNAWGDQWGDQRAELETLEPTLRAAKLNSGWRGGGASHGLVARNERLQGLIT